MVRVIDVVPYRLEWLNQYNEEANSITSILNHEIVQIHHIGSTAIKGMFAKPIIDILAVVRNINNIDKFNDRMTQIGYRPMGEFGIKGRRFFIKGDDELRAHHLHVFQLGNREIKKHLSFRDYLIANPGIAKRYSDLKRKLAKSYPHDINKYMDGKDGFIRKIIFNLRI
jgi:GrpB-like predicted nucleotidyltransferase (UPF0157 family)